MRKKFKRKMIAFAAFLSVLVAGLFISQNHGDALAKSQANTKKTHAQMMARYSYKGKQNAKSNIRQSSLTQMNIVSEAANVLNTLPVNIMDEMKKGKTLEQIANEKGLTKDQFLQKMADFENKAVAAAAKAGTISKDHEDALKVGQKDRLTKSLSLKAANVKDHAPMDMGN